MGASVHAPRQIHSTYMQTFRQSICNTRRPEHPQFTNCHCKWCLQGTNFSVPLDVIMSRYIIIYDTPTSTPTCTECWCHYHREYSDAESISWPLWDQVSGASAVIEIISSMLASVDELIIFTRFGLILIIFFELILLTFLDWIWLTFLFIYSICLTFNAFFSDSSHTHWTPFQSVFRESHISQKRGIFHNSENLNIYLAITP